MVPWIAAFRARPATLLVLITISLGLGVEHPSSSQDLTSGGGQAFPISFGPGSRYFGGNNSVITNDWRNSTSGSGRRQLFTWGGVGHRYGAASATKGNADLGSTSKSASALAACTMHTFFSPRQEDAVKISGNRATLAAWKAAW